MCRHIYITLITFWAAIAASGQTFEVSSPGQLAAGRAVPSHAATITVTGSIDASDLDYLVSAIEEVQTLDLSGADIAAYKGNKVGVNTYSSQANELPAYLLAGLNVTHLKLPASLTAIGAGALMDSRIEDVEIPASVTAIGADAFAQCRSLIHVKLPEGVSEVAERTFEGCEMLSEVLLPETLRTIGARAFLGCSALESIKIPTALTTLDDESFALSGLDAINLDGCTGLTSIGRRAFASCLHLTSATLPSAATTLGEGIFFECASLTAVQLPAKAVTLPSLTLKGAENLADIQLPESTTEIGRLAMAGMTAVETVTLPSSLSHIGDGAFENWSGAKEIDATLLNAVPTLGEEVWAGVEQPKVSLNVQPGLEEAFLAAPQWQDFSIRKTSITLLPSINGSDSQIEARFNGKILTVEASAMLESVTVYAIDGRILTMADNIADNSVSIDTSRYAGAFFIVKAVTNADSMAVTFKLMREP